MVDPELTLSVRGAFIRLFALASSRCRTELLGDRGGEAESIAIRYV